MVNGMTSDGNASCSLGYGCARTNSPDGHGPLKRNLTPSEDPALRSAAMNRSRSSRSSSANHRCFLRSWRDRHSRTIPTVTVLSFASIAATRASVSCRRFKYSRPFTGVAKSARSSSAQVAVSSYWTVPSSRGRAYHYFAQHLLILQFGRLPRRPRQQCLRIRNLAPIDPQLAEIVRNHRPLGDTDQIWYGVTVG